VISILLVVLMLGFPVGVFAEPDGVDGSTWTMSMSGRALGRGTGVGGSEGAFREDYDTLGSGGGAETRFKGHDERGHYFEGAASILGIDDGRGVGGASVHVRGGQRGFYTLTGAFSRAQSFFDDHVRRPGAGRAAPGQLGREFDLVRTNGDIAADVRLGPRSNLRLAYAHRASDGDANLLKASGVESLSPYAFRFPAFHNIDTRSDSLDFEGLFPAGPLDVRLVAGWTDAASRTTTNQTNVRSDLSQESVRFTDDIDTTTVHAGADIATPTTWSVLGHAGYRYYWVDADADASQRTDSVLERTANGISVTQHSHAGHSGIAFSPARHLLVRTTYTIVDQRRDGDGSETRQRGASVVESDTDKRLTRQRARLDVSYAGLRRTRLRGMYRYEHSHRDLDVSMLGAATDPLSGIDRIQGTDQKRDVHRLLLEARIRADRALLVKAGYRYRREDIDEDRTELVNEYTLGDRHRETHTGFLGGRYRWGRITTFEARGEFEHEDYERTDIRGDSTTSVNAQIGHLRAVTVPAPGLVVTGMFSVVNRKYEIGKPRRDLSIFAPIEFRGRSLSTALAARYRVNDQTTLGGRYALIDAGGSLDNLTHRLFLDGGYRVNDRLSFTGGYAYLSFDQGLYDGRDYDAHLGWVAVQLAFSAG